MSNTETRDLFLQVSFLHLPQLESMSTPVQLLLPLLAFARERALYLLARFKAVPFIRVVTYVALRPRG
jgi:hypothetical protein